MQIKRLGWGCEGEGQEVGRFKVCLHTGKEDDGFEMQGGPLNLKIDVIAGLGIQSDKATTWLNAFYQADQRGEPFVLDSNSLGHFGLQVTTFECRPLDLIQLTPWTPMKFVPGNMGVPVIVYEVDIYALKDGKSEISEWTFARLKAAHVDLERDPEDAYGKQREYGTAYDKIGVEMPFTGLGPVSNAMVGISDWGDPLVRASAQVWIDAAAESSEALNELLSQWWEGVAGNIGQIWRAQQKLEQHLYGRNSFWASPRRDKLPWSPPSDEQLALARRRWGL